MDKSKPMVVYCDSGYRASIATSILQQNGFSHVCNIPGSWQAWKNAGSWMFAELSGWTKRTVERWGDLGKVLLPDLLRVPRGVFVVCFAAALIGLLVVLEQFTTR